MVVAVAVVVVSVVVTIVVVCLPAAVLRCHSSGPQCASIISTIISSYFYDH